MGVSTDGKWKDGEQDRFIRSEIIMLPREYNYKLNCKFVNCFFEILGRVYGYEPGNF